MWRMVKHGGTLRGDVNGDGEIDINDVTALIAYVLTGSEEGINLEGADCDITPGIDINDITALIGHVLTGSWPDE